MKNCKLMRNELSNVFQQLRKGEITVDEAAELANIAGKMIQSAKVQVAYYELLNQPAEIEFLRDDKA
jgi:hypothetical protein